VGQGWTSTAVCLQVQLDGYHKNDLLVNETNVSQPVQRHNYQELYRRSHTSLTSDFRKQRAVFTLACFVVDQMPLASFRVSERVQPWDWLPQFLNCFNTFKKCCCSLL
jgi:hypothetical protein